MDLIKNMPDRGIDGGSAVMHGGGSKGIFPDGDAIGSECRAAAI